MATKEESPLLQHQGSAEEEHSSPKKRRKVNHGRCDTHKLLTALPIADGCLDSMCLLSAIGKQIASWGVIFMAPVYSILVGIDVNG